MNYFELFNLPVTLKVDKSQLAKKYFELQKQFHPDFFIQASEDEQADALEKSSMLNTCLLYTSPSPRDRTRSRMPSSA